MAFFPQLSTGVASQYPLRRKQIFRTVVNRMMDGRQIKKFDAGGSSLEIEMELNGLTDAEAAEIETFFAEQEGRRNTFGFLDPAANLLLWSEDFSKTAWTRGPLLALTTGQDDPWGGTRATQMANTAIAPQAVVQVLNAPGGYRYALSVWLLGSAPGMVTLFAASGGFTQTRQVSVRQSWQRYEMSVDLPSTANSIGFGWELPVGATVRAVGAQVDAQPAAAGYRRTTSRQGVYPKVRFAADTFARIAHGVDDHSATVKILAQVA